MNSATFTQSRAICPNTSLRSRRPMRQSMMRNRAPTPVKAFLTPDVLFQAASGLVFPAYGSMIFFPKAKFTKTLISKPFVFVLFGLFYMVGLYQAISSGAFEPAFQHGTSIASIGALMANKLMVSLAWVHLLCLDLFTARYVFLDCLKVGVEHRLSVVLCFMFGPLGLLSHSIFKLARKGGSMEQRGSDDGSVTYSF